MTGSYPYYGPTGVLDHINEYRYEGEFALIGEDGDNFLKFAAEPMTLIASGRFNVNNHAHVIGERNRNSVRWFQRFFEHRDITRSLTRQGVGRYKLTKAALQGLPLAIPSPDEQDAIVCVLDDMDDLIDSLDRLLAKKQAIKQGMMQQLLTGKTRLPGFTEPWLEGPFEDLAAPTRERADPRKVSAHTRLIDLEHVAGGSGRLTGYSSAADAVSMKTVFRPSDVLFGKLRAYLRKYWLADVGGLCSTEIWALRAKADNIGPFVRYVVETDRFVEVASGGYGTHMPRSDWGVVRKLPVAVPPPDEQAAISRVLLEADKEIGLLHERVGKATAVKRGMMQELLTGRARLPVQGAA
jgi:type I restriction enzyme S subunit